MILLIKNARDWLSKKLTGFLVYYAHNFKSEFLNIIFQKLYKISFQMPYYTISYHFYNSSYDGISLKLIFGKNRNLMQKINLMICCEIINIFHEKNNSKTTNSDFWQILWIIARIKVNHDNLLNENIDNFTKKSGDWFLHQFSVFSEKSIFPEYYHN